jgi:glucose/arabinose dehydrogenase
MCILRRTAGASAIILAFIAPPAPAAVTVPAGFESRTLATGLDQPVQVAWAPGGRVLIATKPGLVYFLDPGAPGAQKLLDISSHVNSFHDRGLEGIAVDSDYTSNHYLWLLYVYEPDPNTPNDQGPKTSRLTRVTVNADGTTSAETVVLGTVSSAPCPTPDNQIDCIPADSSSHAVGTVRSAPDGTLWVGSGDAASYGGVDQLAFRTYDERSYAGKILHVDRSGNGLPGHPFCPAGGGQADDLTRVCAKAYAKGFRNPFRFELRPGAGPIVGDVGWNTREELDLISPGSNYGWPCYEGGAGTASGAQTPSYSADPQCSGTGGIYSLEGTALAASPPVYDYVHYQSAAIIGGPLLPAGGSYPAQYAGKVFFGDYAGATISTYDPASGSVQPFAGNVHVVDLETAPDGNLAYVDIWTGEVGEIAYAPDGLSPVAVATASPRGGDLPLTTHFDGSDSRDPNGGALTYHWDFGDGTSSDEASPTHTYSSAGRVTVWLTVTNTAGKSASAAVEVAPGDHFPSAHIDSPAASSAYVDGGSVHVSGSGTDPDPGPGPHLDWQVILHHADHVHFIGEWFDRSSFDWQTLTDHDADSYYEIKLTATDSSGLSDTQSVAIHPETVPLSLDSSPAGAPLTYSGRQVNAPYDALAAVGFKTSVSAAESLQQDGRTWTFDHWSDGGALLHAVTIGPAALTLTAVYRSSDSAGFPAVVLPGASVSGAGPVPQRCRVVRRRGHHHVRRAAQRCASKKAKRRRSGHHRRKLR